MKESNQTRWVVIPLFIFMLFALLALTSTPARAQDPQPTPSDDQVNAIAKQLYCPVCENIPLDVCPTQACAEWRGLIREKLSQGWTEQQIKTYFAEQYGDRVLAEPPLKGLNWMVYVLPPLFLVGGAVILWLNVLKPARMKARQAAASQPQAAVRAPNGSRAEDPYLAQFEQELRAKEDE